MLIAARFSGSGSGKDLLSRAISLIAFGCCHSLASRYPSRLTRIEDGTGLLAESRALEEGWPTGCGRSEIRYSETGENFACGTERHRRTILR
jgi:hypothetical protein